MYLSLGEHHSFWALSGFREATWGLRGVTVRRLDQRFGPGSVAGGWGGAEPAPASKVESGYQDGWVDSNMPARVGPTRWQLVVGAVKW